MNNEPWVVKTQSGTVWGKICRVIIDPASRQIACVDVMLADTNRFIRVLWKSLELEHDDIVLSLSDGEVQASALPSEVNVSDTVMLEESTPDVH